MFEVNSEDIRNLYSKCDYLGLEGLHPREINRLHVTSLHNRAKTLIDEAKRLIEEANVILKRNGSTPSSIYSLDAY